METVIGIDEVGRGAWAGPLLVIAARMSSAVPVGLTDSKLLVKQQRTALMKELVTSCTFGHGWVTAPEIDAYGLAEAMRLGVSRALAALGAKPDDEIIMDGNSNYCPQIYTKVQPLIRADTLIPTVSAASVYAKVLRDGYMSRLSQFFPQYAFERHVGYGTKLHRERLKQFGVSLVHRRSFRPIKELL